ncbi:YHS domain-containing (seleno)protein [uncultured Sulfitobacter sp.]|uniref:YHS domain-containing (seleno)protein n=1 Tax=uncultured Sulfitobacter sp. TaxID=191468 RepID=UPI0026367BB8|nr:YHS domain-containing (seleno)protein [uncultured Sulfitobacter sp.]
MTLTKRHFLFSAAAFAGYSALPTMAFAKTPAIYVEDGIAIDGTDPVAYFIQGAPVQGSPEFTYSYNGATWQFSSAANRDTFAADPAAYAPQYGGYCAYTVSEGYTASTTPKAWKIMDGKLYLNYSKRIQRRWEKDIPTRITNANTNWPRVLE